jgi:hypothetical protein
MFFVPFSVYTHICAKKRLSNQRIARIPGNALSGRCANRRVLGQQTIEAFSAKRELDPRLCFLPQRPGESERLFSFLGQKYQAHAPILALLNTNQVLFGKNLQVAGKGRPIHDQDLRQTIERDWCRFCNRGKQGKLCDVKATWGQNLVVELGEGTIGAQAQRRTSLISIWSLILFLLDY